MSEERHPVVELLLARMESNPEEFGWAESRWGYLLGQVEEYSSDEERRAIKAALRPIHLDEAHKWMMDELFNGDERRAEAERNLMAANRTAQAVAQLNASANLRQYQNAAGTYTTGAPLSLQNTVTSAITPVNSIQLGNEQLDESTLTKIKKALGI
jgi:hypothetical protein